MTKIKQSTIVCGICIGLGLLVIAIYVRTIKFDFVNFDDGSYVYANPRVMQGITVDNLVWAFTSTHASFWHPLTTISHMLDVEMYGKWAGGHHLTNFLTHAATAIMLFLALFRLTKDLWPSAFAAAAFAVHPLRVESVAWIAERKDVLSGLFFSLTLLAYARYAERPSPWRFLLVVFMFSCGLMSKPMLVTVPFVLLLLDYWPLRRLYAQRAEMLPVGHVADVSAIFRTRWQRVPAARRVVLEKVPLLAITGVLSVVTFVVQSPAIQAGNEIPFGARVANAVVSYIAYIRQMLVPFGLSVFYPYPKNGQPAWQVIGAFALLISITAAAIVVRRRWPYLLVGWLWYVGMLVPVIGLVQSGLQARADRFTYLPQIGLIIAVTWWVAELSAEWKNRNGVLRAVAAVVIVIWSVIAFAQTRHWRSSGWLFDHAVACTEDNAVAHRLFANALADEGQLGAAAEQFRRALSIKPRYANALCDYGVLLYKLDAAEGGVNQRLDEAASRLRAGLALDPSNVRALTTLGGVYLRLGRPNEVEPLLKQALELDPRSAAAYFVLGELRMKQGNLEDAISCFHRALSIEPANADMHMRLAIASFKAKKPGDALAEFRETVRLAPNNIKVLYDAARLAATSEYPEARSGREALEWSSRAAALCNWQIPEVVDVVAASYAEVGRSEDAVRAAEQALKLAVGMYASRARIIQLHLKVYESGAQLRDPLSDMQ